MNEARDHHFVPKFLLRAWTINTKLNGYWWDPRHRRLICKTKGVSSFCKQLDLLTLSRHELGIDAIERIFFHFVDTRGAHVREKMLFNGIGSLDGKERSDFARFLLSLEMRKPESVHFLRAESKKWVDEFNSDQNLISKLATDGFKGTPVEYWIAKGKANLEDQALMLIQELVDNKTLGPILINSQWRIISLEHEEERFVLGDRPLMRFGGLGDPNFAWVLPLDPLNIFIAAPNLDTIRAFERAKPRRFAVMANTDSARHAERFVFSVKEQHTRWLGRYLKAKPHVARFKNNT